MRDAFDDCRRRATFDYINIATTIALNPKVDRLAHTVELLHGHMMRDDELAFMLLNPLITFKEPVLLEAHQIAMAETVLIVFSTKN